MQEVAITPELNLTKGAVSYQMRQLEKELGFHLFLRHQGGITLTEKGKRLWFSAQSSFRELQSSWTFLCRED